ncbi:MAG: hypothetical protein JW811_01030 [Clostridiales bacterium]|nr:hypothetical protein [Clostridiales bacterium]
MMKKIASLVCVLLLLLTVVSVPTALATGVDYSGAWNCMYVDFGDGVLLSEYQGMNLQEMMQLQLNSDGSFELNSFGEVITGVWQPTGAGIALIAEGEVVAFSYEDDMLVNTDEGITMYFARAEETPQQGGLSALMNLGQTNETPDVEFAGNWNCISYEASGVSYDISMFFPDGITMTLNPDGTGSVQITAEYAETITWAAADGELTIDGSYVLFDPVWDADTDTLSLCYAVDIIRIVFEKVEGNTAAPDASAALPQVYTCDFFTVTFPEDWEQDEFFTYNWDTYYSVQYNLSDASGSTLSSVHISVSIEEVDDYRSRIDELLEYATEDGSGALDEGMIGGVMFRSKTYGDYWIYTEYCARVPEASVTIYVAISEPENIPDVLPDILNSISFTYPIPDPPLEDPPLPEDGVPYQPSPTAFNVGGYDLQAEWLTTGASIIPKNEYDDSIAAIDDTVYVLASEKLYALERSGATLAAAPDSPVALGDAYSLLSAAWDGTLYITNGFYSAIAYKDGTAEEFDMDGYLAMHPEGNWGLCYWSSYTVKKITFTPDGIATKDWILKDLSEDTRQGRFSSVSHIQITPDYIFVGGVDSATEYATRIAMYDLDGNELAVFGSEDWSDYSAIGSVAGIAQTNNGILVMDGYNEDIKLFALDGSFLGLIGCDELLGTDNPWPLGLTASENGALALLAQKREDGSAIELLVFELTGF